MSRRAVPRCDRVPGGYIPLDELLAQGPTRVLRALRFCGWIDVWDFRELVLNCTHEDRRSKDAISTALQRLTRAGLIEKRDSSGRSWGKGSPAFCYDIRITPAGREYLARKLAPDTREEFEPARPGTEQWLCA